MPKFVDLTGQRFGCLTVLSLGEVLASPGARSARRMWQCQCDCGNLTEVRANNLRSGNTKSCGCMRRNQPARSAKRLDLTGQRFGHLTALRLSDRRTTPRLWTCRCDCGTVLDVWANNLCSGNSQSCGCMRLGKPIRRPKRAGYGSKMRKPGQEANREASTPSDPAAPSLAG